VADLFDGALDLGEFELGKVALAHLLPHRLHAVDLLVLLALHLAKTYEIDPLNFATYRRNFMQTPHLGLRVNFLGGVMDLGHLPERADVADDLFLFLGLFEHFTPDLICADEET
jgi:hypothetical protein